MTRVGGWLRSFLIEPADPVADVASGRRRRVIAVVATLIAGTILLGLLLRVRPGNALFYPLALLQAALWTVGGLCSGPIRLFRPPANRRPAALAGLFTGLALGAVFIVGAMIVRGVPVLHDAVTDVLQYAGGAAVTAATLVAVANGVAEEIFFRGAVFAAATRHLPVVVSTLVYTATTVATGNLILVFAAIAVGLVLGLQRRATGDVLAPTITHVTWSLLMLLVLPLFF
jgi:membrane protease YdiL (CAAX protease family)